jgi:hypothetical protein
VKKVVQLRCYCVTTVDQDIDTSVLEQLLDCFLESHVNCAYDV